MAQFLLTHQDYDSSFQLLLNLAKNLVEPSVSEEEANQFIKSWEKLARQALLAANFSRLQALVALLRNFTQNYPDWQILAYRYVAKMSWVSGNLGQATSLFEQALAHAQNQKNPAVMIDGLIELAEVLEAQGRITQSESLFREALQLSYEHSLIFYQARCLNRLTGLYLPQQRWDNAQTSLEHSYYLLQTLKNKAEVDNIQIGLEEAFNRQWAGMNYATAGQWREAEKTLLESSTLSYRYKDVLGIAETQLKLGSVYYHTGRYEDALVCFEGSQQICEKIRYMPVLLQTFYYLSLTYSAMKQPAKALNPARRAVKIGQELGRGVWAAWALYQLGQVHRQLKMNSSALNYHLQAIKLYEPEDQHPQWIDLLIGLGDFLLSLRDQPEYWGQALECFRKAIKLMEANERLEHLAGTLGKMARAFIKLKNQEGLDDAIRCYNLQLKLAGDLDSTVLPQDVAVALRVEALTGIQTCAALRINQSPWKLPQEFQEIGSDLVAET